MPVASLFEDLLDQYKIEQRLAEKRYTDLYQAYDVDDDRLVRLDVMRSGAAEDGGFVARFVNRARAVAQLRHPNITPIYHIGKTAEGLPYVAQAYIDGLPLSSRLEQLAQRKAPVNPIYALKLVRQLADALVLAERLELFHYDLQPENVLLKNVALPSDDSVVLLDLFVPADKGISRTADAADERLAYLSPEQRAGKDIGSASHVYSLGVLLYRLLGGQLPEGAVNWQGAAVRRGAGRPTALERLRLGLSPLTYDLVERCLRREPGRRFESVEAFVVALDHALDAEEARIGAGAGQEEPRRRVLAWLMPILLLALVATAAVRAARNHRDRALASEATSSAVAGAGMGDTTPTLLPSLTGLPTQPTEDATQAALVAAATLADEERAEELTPIPPTVTAEPTLPPVSPTVTPSAVPTETATPTPQPTLTPIVRVALNLVNLRRGPGVLYPLVGSVRAGDRLQVLAWNNIPESPWYLVATGDQRLGWISAEVVEADDPAALSAVPVAATLPPTPFATATPPLVPSGTPTATLAVTMTATPGENLGGDEPPATEPPPTQEPPPEPSLTPPPLP